MEVVRLGFLLENVRCTYFIRKVVILLLVLLHCLANVGATILKGTYTVDHGIKLFGISLQNLDISGYKKLKLY